MHSSTLRGTDFQISVNGIGQCHSDFFAHVHKNQRLGVIAPERVEGVGAINLIMAYVTAFYDRYRAEGESFYAYPNYYAFQYKTPLAHYTDLDIWPTHKNVFAGKTAVSHLNTITDYGINTLLLPEGEQKEHHYERPQLESARRQIEQCYLYSFDGNVTNADVTICCEKEPLLEWGTDVFQTEEIANEPEIAQWRTRWLQMTSTQPKLTQSYRRISLDEALTYL